MEIVFICDKVKMEKLAPYMRNMTKGADFIFSKRYELHKTLFTHLVFDTVSDKYLNASEGWYYHQDSNLYIHINDIVKAYNTFNEDTKASNANLKTKFVKKLLEQF